MFISTLYIKTKIPFTFWKRSFLKLLRLYPRKDDTEAFYFD